MDTTILSQSLANIEKNLKDLETARQQVEKVTQNGNNLTDATHQLAIEVKQITEVIKTETSAVIDEFSESLKGFEKNFQSILKTNQKETTNQLDQFGNTVTKLEGETGETLKEVEKVAINTLKRQDKNNIKQWDSLTTQFSDALEDIEKNIKVLTENHNTIIADNLERFKNSVFNLETTGTTTIKKTGLLATDAINKQQREIEKTTEILLANLEELNNLTKLLSDAQLPEKLKGITATLYTNHLMIIDNLGNVENNISTQLKQFSDSQISLAKKQQRNFYITWVMIVLGSIALINFLY